MPGTNTSDRLRGRADDVYRQAITAAGMGCMAALEAEKVLADLEIGETSARAAAE